MLEEMFVLKSREIPLWIVFSYGTVAVCTAAAALEVRPEQSSVSWMFPKNQGFQPLLSLG
jgi:hypothetical protein